MYEKIVREPVPFPKEPRVSAELRSLLKGLLCKVGGRDGSKLRDRCVACGE